MSSNRSSRPWPGLLAALFCLSAGLTLAAPDEGRGGPRGHDNSPRERAPADTARGQVHGAPAPGPAHGAAPGANRWYDGAHGHGRYYPTPGWAVRSLPPRTSIVFWGGVSYGFFDGIWYSPGPRGYVVVRPPYGIVVADLPLFRTVVTVGGIGYLYADGVYYRERTEGGYEVVPPPVAGDAAAANGVTVGNSPASGGRMYIYPRQAQTAQQQATDEYECHRWAVSQSGFDPSAAATATLGSAQARRGDYQRAQSACLEGRGYTVR